jgi:hypothetical protein
MGGCGMKKSFGVFAVVWVLLGLLAIAGCGGGAQTTGAKNSDLNLSQYIQANLTKGGGKFLLIDWKQFPHPDQNADDNVRMTSDGRYTLHLPNGLANISTAGTWKVDDKSNSIIFTGDDGKVVTLPMKKTVIKTDVGAPGTFLEWKAALPDKNAYVSFGQEEVK